ncbi:LD-carboxypeptidase LdcB/DacB [Streptococcus sp. NLN76]|uniref:LD-carboxypeptidase LdcB/DacB n=1 Tax=Streptococcus sp. NLN76 TaxID=2822800 RepID=UPI0018AA245F|nr:LD-carboxypeptidase LdcB/DacB [Streptococcus sp. NLN76]MBF8970140.1 M15 family metallopeptidase [Streptococcus sp. NLN76]
MKSKKWFGLILMTLALVACGQESATTQENKTNTESNQTAKNDSNESSSSKSSTQQKEAKMDTKATYNGDYYSVKGSEGQEIIIVNKKHPLNANYAPGEDPQAQAVFMQLIADMQEKGFAVSNQYSGYRSYETQVGLYQSYVDRDGQANADRYSARAGYSEHQTGLAFDLIDSSGNLLTDKEASKWLRDHAADYGFIVRYTEDKEDITGYTAESWHVRYIGSEAKDIAKSGLTLEEYFGVPGGDYEN